MRAEQAKEDRLGLDKLLEHQIMYPAEKRRKEEKEKQKERTHLPSKGNGIGPSPQIYKPVPNF